MYENGMLLLVLVQNMRFVILYWLNGIGTALQDMRTVQNGTQKRPQILVTCR